MIPQDNIDKLGGDWGQYGEVVGQQLIALMQANKLSMVFADKGIMIGVERPDGTTGVYNLRHEDVKSF